ncbi:MAG TPA: DMT family transporter [bacterium]|nr:DMT family transporter [bacterium]
MRRPRSSAAPSAPRGIVCMVAAFLFVAVTGSLVKQAVASGLPTAVVVFFESLIPLLAVTAWHLRRGLKKFSLPSGRYGLQFLQGSLAFFTSYLMYLAIRTVPVSSGVLLNSSAPLFIPVISYFWFRRRLSPGLIAAVAVGFVGIVLILDPAAGTFARPGILLALASGVAVAFDDIVVGLLDDAGTEREDVTLFFVFLMTALLSGLFAAPVWKTPRGAQWIYLFAAAAGFLFIELFLVRSFSFAPVAVVSPFMYFGVVFAGVIDWLAWGEVPGLRMLAGVALVVILAGVWFSKSQATSFGDDEDAAAKAGAAS